MFLTNQQNAMKTENTKTSRVFSNFFFDFLPLAERNKKRSQLKTARSYIFFFTYFSLKTSSLNCFYSGKFEHREFRRDKEKTLAAKQTNKQTLNFNFHILPLNGLQFVCFCILFTLISLAKLAYQTSSNRVQTTFFSHLFLKKKKCLSRFHNHNYWLYVVVC